MKWISKQKLAQQFSQTRSGGTTNYFVPVSPFHSMSVDLIDFNFKPSGSLKYIIVLVDNFSRLMFTAPISGKTADKTTKGMEKIFKEINDTHGQEALDKIKYINSDDGSEFKGSYDELLKTMTTPKRPNGIKRFRTLGGNPAQNGLVERQNGKVKMILAKLIKIKGGSWGNHTKTMYIQLMACVVNGKTPSERAVELIARQKTQAQMDKEEKERAEARWIRDSKLKTTKRWRGLYDVHVRMETGVLRALGRGYSGRN